MILSLVLFLIGFLICFLLTPWVIRLAHRANMGLDAPDQNRKRQEVPIPRLGGMPIICALSVGLIMILMTRPDCATTFFPVLLGSLCMCGLGLWDDFKPLGARKKLAGQIAIAALVYWMGLRIDRVTYPGGRLERVSAAIAQHDLDDFLAYFPAECGQSYRRVRWAGGRAGSLHGGDARHRGLAE